MALGRLRRVGATVVAVGLVAALAACQPTKTETVTVDFDCEARPPIGGAQHDTQTMTFDTTAPTAVSPEGELTITVKPHPLEVPASASGYTLKNMRDISLRVSVPEGSTFVDASLSGGSGLGSGRPTATHEGDAVVVRVPGPVPGGTAPTFPTLTLKAKANGAVGDTLEPRIAGASFADPGMEFTVTVASPVGDLKVPTSCFPTAPNPVLSSTPIRDDTSAPSVKITSPLSGAVYVAGAEVPADFACTEEAGGSGLASCEGAVASGSAIDTSTPGTHRFTVTGTDKAGNARTGDATYTVVAAPGDVVPPTVTLTSPAEGAAYRVGQSVVADFACADEAAGSGIATCEGTAATGAELDTSTPGAASFTVDAVDDAGNPARVVHHYRVIEGDPTIIGPQRAGTISGGSVNLDGTTATVKVEAPAANGGELAVGDIITVDWSIFRAKRGVGYTSNWGPDPLVWSLPAPTNTVISGPVTVDQEGLNGETRGQAHAGKDSTGLKSIEPSADPDDAAEITVNFDGNSRPRAIPVDDGDGVLVHVRFTARVTDQGPVTIQGFPPLTGRDCGAFGASCGNIRTDQGITAEQVGIAYRAVGSGGGGGPQIDISSPSQGFMAAKGASIALVYSCTEGSSPIAECTSDAINAKPGLALLDTAAAGRHQVKITAVDEAGSTSERWLTYQVVDVGD